MKMDSQLDSSAVRVLASNASFPPGALSLENYSSTMARLSEKNFASPNFEPDLISQLSRNMSHLEELHGRLRFMLREISSLLPSGSSRSDFHLP